MLNGPKAAVLSAARKAGRVAYHNLASHVLHWRGHAGVDAQEYAQAAFAEEYGACSSRLQAFVERAFREAMEREYTPEGPESPDFVLDVLTVASDPRMVRDVPSPIAGVINARARKQLALAMND